MGKNVSMIIQCKLSQKCKDQGRGEMVVMVVWKWNGVGSVHPGKKNNKNIKSQMKKFKYSTIRTINNKVCFSTKSRVYADKNIYFERNKHITDNSTKIEAVSSSPVNKNLTSDELIDELEKNKQQLHNNMSSAYNLIEETDIL